MDGKRESTEFMLLVYLDNDNLPMVIALFECVDCTQKFHLRMLRAIYRTSSGGSTQQSSSCTATYHPSLKLSKLDKPDMRDTAGEVGMSSEVMYSCGPTHMVEQRQDNQLEPTYSSSEPIRDVALKTCQEQWMIGRVGERGSGISMLIAHDDDDDNILKDRAGRSY